MLKQHLKDFLESPTLNKCRSYGNITCWLIEGNSSLITDGVHLLRIRKLSKRIDHQINDRDIKEALGISVVLEGIKFSLIKENQPSIDISRIKKVHLENQIRNLSTLSGEILVDIDCSSIKVRICRSIEEVKDIDTNKLQFIIQDKEIKYLLEKCKRDDIHTIRVKNYKTSLHNPLQVCLNLVKSWNNKNNQIDFVKGTKSSIRDLKITNKRIKEIINENSGSMSSNERTRRIAENILGGKADENMRKRIGKRYSKKPPLPNIRNNPPVNCVDLVNSIESPSWKKNLQREKYDKPQALKKVLHQREGRRLKKNKHLKKAIEVQSISTAQKKNLSKELDILQTRRHEQLKKTGPLSCTQPDLNEKEKRQYSSGRLSRSVEESPHQIPNKQEKNKQKKTRMYARILGSIEKNKKSKDVAEFGDIIKKMTPINIIEPDEEIINHISSVVRITKKKEVQPPKSSAQAVYAEQSISNVKSNLARRTRFELNVVRIYGEIRKKRKLI